MTNAQHTPGPWFPSWSMVGPHGEVIVISRCELDAKAKVVEDRFYDDAIIAVVTGEMKRAKEDARLIAAAPELLEALELVFKGHNTGGEFLDIINAVENAIAKAKGSKP